MAKAYKVKGGGGIQLHVVEEGNPQGRPVLFIFKDCPSHSIFDTRLRAEVIAPIKELIARLGQQDVREAVYAELTQRQEGVQASASQSRRTLEETMEKLEARLSRLEDSYLDKDLSRDRYLTRRDEILDQLEEIKGQLAERPTSIAPDHKQLFAIADAITVETLDDEAWRDIVEEMIDRIIIEGTGDGRKSPSIIKVVWKPAYEPLFTMVTERQ